MSNETDDVVALPAVEVDPVFVAAVEEALSGAGLAPTHPSRALGADPHDFAGLYIRHRSSFAMHARRFLRDPRDVDEVVQEAFLRLFLALPELSTELQALAYCRRTVTNLCIDRYRADKRRPRLVNIESVPQNDFAEEETDDPVVQAEDAAFVREALSLLTPLHRDALVKREIEEKSIPVIALELGVPEESVKHLLHRARRALRRHLAKTHLAPGANLEEVTTLSLLARSAAAGGGRAGVAVLFLLICLIGAKPDLPATALTSWPLHDLLPAVGRVLSPTPSQPAPSPSPAQTAVTPRLQAPTVVGTDQASPSHDTAIAGPSVSPSPSASVMSVVKPKPALTPLAKPGPLGSSAPTTGAPAPSTANASGSPSASPSGSTSPSPSTSPRPTTTTDPRQAQIQSSPSPSSSGSPSPTA